MFPSKNLASEKKKPQQNLLLHKNKNVKFSFTGQNINRVNERVIQIGSGSANASKMCFMSASFFFAQVVLHTV